MEQQTKCHRDEVFTRPRDPAASTAPQQLCKSLPSRSAHVNEMYRERKKRKGRNNGEKVSGKRALCRRDLAVIPRFLVGSANIAPCRPARNYAGPKYETGTPRSSSRARPFPVFLARRKRESTRYRSTRIASHICRTARNNTQVV